jgi:hypothetical protein
MGSTSQSPFRGSSNIPTAHKQRLSSEECTLKYGLLKYSTTNLGDDIQSLAVSRMLPTIDLLVDRDKIGGVSIARAERMRMIVNGWFMHTPALWPPPPNLETLITSLHISPVLQATDPIGASPAEIIFSDENIGYLRDRAPIGARDTATLKLLQNAGIESYYSACLTLTMRRSDVRERSKDVVISDLSREVKQHILEQSPRRVTEVTHVVNRDTPPLERFRLAQRLLDTYANAGVVVTSRLHCALPCIAFGTPVLWVIGPRSPELRVISDVENRSSGLADLVHWCTPESLLKGEHAYSLSTPPPSPRRHLELARSLEERVTSFLVSD